jgi:hypothetical protein
MVTFATDNQRRNLSMAKFAPGSVVCSVEGKKVILTIEFDCHCEICAQDVCKSLYDEALGRGSLSFTTDESSLSGDYIN